MCIRSDSSTIVQARRELPDKVASLMFRAGLQVKDIEQVLDQIKGLLAQPTAMAGFTGSGKFAGTEAVE